METLSKTKIDRLGDRLRKGNLTDDDLRLLDEYRRSFAAAYDAVVGTIRTKLGLEPTGRPAKSTTSITEKLRRESIRLSQVQDIAGCRLIVPEIADQERVITSLVEIFPESTIADRRQKPSHGYRAVHIIASINKKTVEIQVRTELQQAWAELSEKLSDLVDPSIKYGRGDEDIIELLAEASMAVAEQENLEFSALETQAGIDKLSNDDLTDDVRDVIVRFKELFDSHKADLAAAREDVLNELRIAAERFEE